MKLPLLLLLFVTCVLGDANEGDGPIEEMWYGSPEAPDWYKFEEADSPSEFTDVEERIVGGSDAFPGQFPYVVSLKTPDESGFQHFCGGSILTEEWILTAAHCVINLNVSDYVVVAGEYDLTVDEGTEQVVGVSEAFIYPYLAHGGLYNDTALLRLNSSLEFNVNVSAISLPEYNSTPEAGSNATMMGWGSTSNTSQPTWPSRLQWAVVPVISLQECIPLASNVPGVNHLCTDALPDKSICTRDPGGPLVQDAVVIGIASWNLNPCTAYPYPSIFCQVSNFLDFIYDVMSSGR
ncbi:trypsin-1-like [Schistocerca americana]|uniref:trypsin-1-like n=1 Tax=Schistocerca americana TaxID=7009 RepID=UPI001F5030B2|nr:trypsin-1-like [Schistocerca americana]